MKTFEDSDFETVGLSQEDAVYYSTHLKASYVSETVIAVESSSHSRSYHVSHCYAEPERCECTAAKYHKGVCKSHFARVQLVLDRRKSRRHAATLEAQRIREERERMGTYLTRRPGFALPSKTF